MATLLLVHGAWHGSWCWAKVASVLADRGVSAVALDLPGRTGDEAPVEQLTLENYARKVCQIAASQNRPVILVGHSLGGMIISQAAEFHSEYFSKLVYLCAFLPQGGQSVSSLGANSTGMVQPNLLPNTPRPGYFWFKPDAPLREIFYHDCPEDDVRRAKAMLMPEAMSPMLTPAHLSAARFGRVPRFYIECFQDRAIPLPLQKSMHAASPCASIFA